MINKLLKQEDINRLAYINKEEKITYQELINRIKFYSEILSKQGSSPVLIYGHKESTSLITMLSCLIASRPYIPVDIFTPKKRIENIISIAKPGFCITDYDISFNKIKNYKLKDISEIPKEKETIKSNVAYIIFTSGSTGTPKGVPITRDNLNNFIKWISNIKPLNEYHHLNVLNQASFSFDLSVADIYYSLCNNHTLVSVDKEEQEDISCLINRIKEEKINLIVATPSFVRYCLINKNFNIDYLKDLKTIYFCGETLDIELVNKLYTRFPNINIINAYGPTEATSAVSAILLDKNNLSNPLPVGKISSAATNIEIIDNEIVLSGPSVFKGYLNSQETIESYYTNDMGYIDNDKLYCLGRKDNQIKLNGYRIELDEIEITIKNIQSVLDACVIAKKDNKGRVKFIKAFVVLIKKCDIKKELEEKLPSYMIPKQIIILPKLPINKNGKIDRKKLEDYD